MSSYRSSGRFPLFLPLASRSVSIKFSLPERELSQQKSHSSCKKYILAVFGNLESYLATTMRSTIRYVNHSSKRERTTTMFGNHIPRYSLARFLSLFSQCIHIMESFTAFLFQKSEFPPYHKR